MKDNVFVYVELVKGSEDVAKDLNDTRVFKDKASAMGYMYSRYTHIRENMRKGAGIFNEDFSHDGFFALIDNDDEIWEGYVSESLMVESFNN